MKAVDLMHRDVITVLPGHSIRHAAQLMLEHGISGLPVLDDNGDLLGMLTEGDLLRRIEVDATGGKGASWHKSISPEGLARDFVKTHSWRVGDVMSVPVVTVGEDTPLHLVAELLATRNIKRVPVLRGERLVGIISRADLLAWILTNVPEPIAAGDEALRICVLARFRDANTVVGAIPEVRVEKGIVHLRGNLRSDAERNAVRVIVEGVPGIAGVDDRTTVHAA